MGYKNMPPKRKLNTTALITEVRPMIHSLDLTLDDITYIGLYNGRMVVPKENYLTFLIEEHVVDVKVFPVINPDLIIRLSDGSVLQRWVGEGMEGWRVIVTKPTVGHQVLSTPMAVSEESVSNRFHALTY